MKTLIALAGLLVLLHAPLVPAARVAGVEIPDQVTPAGLDRPLQLNGAGVRKKFFFKIYVGALYLPRKESSASAILAADAPNRVLMHFLYDEVSRDKLAAAWREGFAANHAPRALAALESRIGQFSNLFGDAREGDRVWIDYLPGQGTRVTINDEMKGVVPGADFNHALLRVWLGDEPVMEDLKRAMLGLD